MDIFYIIIRVIFICILLYSLIQYVFSTYQILNKDSDSGFDIGIFLLFYIIISAVILFINFGFSFTSNKLPNFFDILSGNNKNEDKSNYIYYPGEIIKKEDNDDEDNNNENTESGDSGNNGESDESGESGDGNEIENFTCCPKKGTTGISGNDISNCDTENTEGSGGGSRSSRNLGPDCNDTFYGCCKNPDGTNSEKISLTYDNVKFFRTNENNRLTEYIGYIILLVILFILLGVLIFLSNGTKLFNKICLLISYLIGFVILALMTNIIPIRNQYIFVQKKGNTTCNELSKPKILNIPNITIALLTIIILYVIFSVGYRKHNNIISNNIFIRFINNGVKHILYIFVIFTSIVF